MPVVVNVGCGLDTRYQRLKDRTRARFYEFDLPDVIRTRRELIGENEWDVCLAGSVLDTDWMDELKRREPGAKFIFIFEGVLMYFSKEQVSRILNNISLRFQGSELFVEMCDAQTAAWKDCDLLQSFDAKLKCGINHGQELVRHVKGLEFIDQIRHSEVAPSRKYDMKEIGALMRFRVNRRTVRNALS
ncbi:MAG: class I SAM-dependent methyltransferase [Paludibacteraceae bacterium]|nr:class I SAM-dependent methyltransferase [Paludibacteraceae bacterium]